jgi:hypothetical protein
MISLTFDLTKSSQLDAAKKEFAIDLYSPPFAKNKLAKDTEKQIKPEEIRKQLKNIRTDLSISAEEAEQLPLVLAIIVSSLVDTKVAVSFVAKKGAEQWETFIVSADIQKIEALADKDLQRLIQSANNLGHFHSKPLNTLSSVQFCRDKEYLATGEFGFTENQLDNKTASVSISGGSNAFSAFYAVLITRINGISIAEHLIDKTPSALIIQNFFKHFICNEEFSKLQAAIQQALSKTARDIGDSLHVMDKQIALPITNENGECGYINITPIINPTVFSATSRSLFYVKEQSVKFINVELGGSNSSNAGTAVGEVSGQNSRLKMSFPVQNINKVRRMMVSLNKQDCCLFSQALKNEISSKLLQSANNPDIPNDTKREMVENVALMAIDQLQQQRDEIRLYLQPLSEQQQQQILNKRYLKFFTTKKITSEENEVWQKAVIRSLERLPKLKDKIDFRPIIEEIKQQFKQRSTKGGL